MTVNFETAVHPLKKIGYERNSWDEFIQINGVNGRLEIFTVMWINLKIIVSCLYITIMKRDINRVQI